MLEISTHFHSHVININPLAADITPATIYSSTRRHQVQSKWVEMFNGLTYCSYLKFPNFQGLRGIASICIMTGHTTRGIFPIYLSSADFYGATPRLFQLPILRLFSAGPFWVAVFFVLSGYVCAVKPLRLANAGKVEETRKTIASSTFRRFLRIGLPATLGTIFCWCVSQVGGGELFSEFEVQCQWTTFVIAKRVPGIIAPLKSLIKHCVRRKNEETTDCSSIHGEMRKINTTAIIGP
jgi:hypothetical protein